MLFGDQDFPSQQTPKSHSVAFVSDRVLACMFDVLLFIPIASFILVEVYKRVDYLFSVDRFSFEFLAMLGVSVFFTLVLVILLQMAFLVLFEATPGKYFFKMKVVPNDHRQPRLRATQALVRSTLWTIELLALGIPYLEVLSHPQRRPLHDRAAETMVVTLKKASDIGPHQLETHFIRHLIFALSVVGLMWGILGVGYVYKMALKGDFKRTELEETGYLCGQVSNHIQAGESRIDKAVALYLADELSSECLTAEADFVLWRPADEELDWAYLAKAFAMRDQKERSRTYQDKVCADYPTSEPCRVLNFLNKPSKDQTFSSLSGKVLALQFLTEEGLYAEAEARSEELRGVAGLEGFSVQQALKNDWMTGKIDQARGLLSGAQSFVTAGARQEMLGWMCNEELDLACSTKSARSCYDLDQEYSEPDTEDALSIGVGVALLRYRECQPQASFRDSALNQLRDQKPSFRAYELALNSETHLSATERKQMFARLAYSKEKSLILKTRSWMEWLKGSLDDKDLQKSMEALKEIPDKDYAWWKVFDKTMAKALERKNGKLALDLIQILPEKLSPLARQRNYQSQAYALSGEKKKADQLRIPASVGREAQKTQEEK